MKQAIRENYGGTTINLSGRGSMIPNEHSFCEIDPDVKDKWGIPVLRFHWQWSDHEINQVRHMRESFRAILESLGGTVNVGRGGGRGRGRGEAASAPAPAGSPTTRRCRRPRKAMRRPRWARAAASSTRSAACGWATIRARASLNRFCRAHNVPNLFVADGGPFVSHADKNPTHTIIALAWRTAEYLAEEMRKGNV